MFGDVSKHQQRRLNVLFVSAIGKCGGQYPIGGLGRCADIPDRYFVFSIFQVRPSGGDVGAVQQFFIDDKRNGAGVSQRPVAVFVLGPVGDLLPSGRLIGLGDALGHGNRAERRAYITDVGAGVVFFSCKLGHFLRRTHVGVDVFEAVEPVQIGPSAFPVGPLIGHAHAVDCTFGTRGGFQALQIDVGGHGRAAQSDA